MELTPSYPFSPDLLQNWLKSTDLPHGSSGSQNSRLQSLENSDPDDALSSQIGLVRSAYWTSTTFARKVWQCFVRSDLPSQSQRFSFRESLGRLYLWGDGIRWESLTACIEENTDLRNCILELLRDFASTIQVRKSVRGLLFLRLADGSIYLSSSAILEKRQRPICT